MANNYVEIMKIVNQGNKMGLSNTITRDNGIPLDLSSVQESKNAAIVYAATKAIAYQGQILSAEGVVYQIVAESQGQVEIDGQTYENYLKPVGTTPSGDEASISVTAEGLVSIFGFEDAETTALPVKNAEGKIEWKTLEAIGAGDGNDNTTYTFAVGADGKSLDITPVHNTVAQDTINVALSVYTVAEADDKFLAKADYTPYDDTELTGRVKAVEDNKANAADVYTKTEVDGAIDDAVKGILGEGVDEAYNTLKEIQDILEGTSGETIDGLIETVDANKQAIEVLNGTGEGSVDKKIADAIGAQNFDDFVTETELTGKGYAVATDVERDYAKKATTLTGYGITDAYTKTEIDNKIGLPGTPAIKDTEGNVTTEAVDGTGIFANAYSKAEVNALLDEVSGGSSETAASVKRQLDEYKASNNERVTTIEGQVGKDVNGEEPATGLFLEVDEARAQADKGVADAATAKGIADKNTTDIANLAKIVSGENAEDTTSHAYRIGALEAHDLAHATEFSTLSGKVDTNIQEIAKKANATDVYTKGEVDGFVNVKANANDVYTKTEIGVIPADTTIVKMIEDAQAAATYDDTEVRGLISAEAERAGQAEAANLAAIEAIYKAGEGDAAATGLLAEEIERAKAAEKANADAIALLTENPTEAIDSVKELIDYVNTHGAVVTGITNRLDGHDELLAGIGGEGEPETVLAAIVASAYELPAATAELLGGVKLSDEVGVNDNGQLEIKTISTDKLVQGENEIIFDGGNASGANAEQA